MKKRTKTILIVIVVLGVLGMAGPSLLWYLRDGERHDPGSQQEAEKQRVEQDKQ